MAEVSPAVQEYQAFESAAREKDVRALVLPALQKQAFQGFRKAPGLLGILVQFGRVGIFLEDPDSDPGIGVRQIVAEAHAFFQHFLIGVVRPVDQVPDKVAAQAVDREILDPFPVEPEEERKGDVFLHQGDVVVRTDHIALPGNDDLSVGSAADLKRDRDTVSGTGSRDVLSRSPRGRFRDRAGTFRRVRAALLQHMVDVVDTDRRGEEIV